MCGTTSITRDIHGWAGYSRLGMTNIFFRDNFHFHSSGNTKTNYKILQDSWRWNGYDELWSTSIYKYTELFSTIRLVTVWDIILTHIGPNFAQHVFFIQLSLSDQIAQMWSPLSITLAKTAVMLCHVKISVAPLWWWMESKQNMTGVGLRKQQKSVRLFAVYLIKLLDLPTDEIILHT